MRQWVYNKVRSLAIPNQFGTPPRVLSSGNDTTNPTKPFLLISFGVETRPIRTTAEMRVQRIPFTVWVHDTPGSMVLIDEAAKVLKDNLPFEDAAVVGNMSLYNLNWEGTGQDAFDDHFGTNARSVEFSMMTRHAL